MDAEADASKLTWRSPDGALILLMRENATGWFTIGV
ncbi:hypothetical protein LMG28138_02413 [Pararobbsia alpina]|uniref:Uncharacterized protein n=1 Tax=Pararobbsia alpina TaxID=621374 RepID=A0A6S7B4A7_9BURK|nr:hypothetical protein LMG28138_02413 [Pararobbsia alpina]